MHEGSCKKSLGRIVWKPVSGCGSLLRLSLGVLLLCGLPALAKPQRAGTRQEPSDPQLAGTISGTVVDRTGAVVAGARVTLSREDQSLSQEATSDGDGQFFFGGVAPGPFQITITSVGFTTETSAGTLQAGENHNVPPVTLALVTVVAEVRVSMSRIEMAEAEIKDEEKQRVLGVIPNFYVTYNPTAVPLGPRQKFELAWKATVDPVNFGLTGAIAGIEQAVNAFSGYGQGARGYAKRFGASYADFVNSTFIGSAILPSLLRQDPRYFYKGKGSKRSRFLYAVANSVICKGDNGHWQANYSGMLGSLAAGGLSNLYYPGQNRHDATLTFENALIGIGSSAANNLLQEFVIRKLTRNPPTYAPANPNAR